MGKKRSYKRYPKEFKEEAVALIREQGYSVSQAAESLGVSTALLYRWKDQQEQRLSSESLSDDEKGELLRLRKEVKTLRMEKEILKNVWSASRLQAQ